jgi:hypothetical protein
MEKLFVAKDSRLLGLRDFSFLLFRLFLSHPSEKSRKNSTENLFTMAEVIHSEIINFTSSRENVAARQTFLLSASVKGKSEAKGEFMSQFRRKFLLVKGFLPCSSRHG